MNILLLTTHLDIGGISNYTIWLAEALKKNNHRVIVASSGGELLTELNKENISHFKVNIRTKKEISPLLLRARSVLAKLVNKENIELIHAQTRITQLLAHHVSKLVKIPYVTTCHGFYKKRLTRRIFPCWGDKVIAISEPVRENLVNYFKLPKDKVRLVHNGLDAGRFSRHYSKEEKEKIKRDYGLKEKGKVVGNIARLVKVKGQEYILHAAKEILKVRPRTQFLIVGGGKEKDRLVDLAKRLDITASVFFTGSLKKVEDVLAIMDIFVFPAFWQEGFGLSILEAMVSGLPVVASNVGGVYTLVKDNKTGFLVPAKDVSSLIDALLRLLDDKKLAFQMGHTGRELAVRDFSLDKVVSQIVDIYKEVL